MELTQWVKGGKGMKTRGLVKELEQAPEVWGQEEGIA
jgi:hypothetical protein